MQTDDPDSGALLAAAAAFVAALEAHAKPYMVLGGFAVAAHGHSRPTTDIDATVWEPRADVDEIVAEFRTMGFAPRIEDWRGLAHAGRMLLLRHVETGVEADLSLALLPFELEAIERSVRRSFVGIELRIASVEDLIIQKAAAFRPIDQADIQALVSLHADAVDVEALVSSFAPLADALGVPDRVDAFAALLEEALR